MATYQVLSWHGIPVQVRARDKSGQVSKKLDDRFMDAVDKAAMASKNFDGDSYTEDLCGGSASNGKAVQDDVASAIVSELEDQHPDIDYRALAKRLREQKSGDT